MWIFFATLILTLFFCFHLLTYNKRDELMVKSVYIQPSFDFMVNQQFQEQTFTVEH